MRRRAPAVIAAAGIFLGGLAAACGLVDTSASSPEIVLDVTGFRPIECGEGGGECFELEAAAAGRGEGTGSCTVRSVDAEGIELAEVARFDDLALTPGATFRWVVEVEPSTDVRFDRWDALCDPRPEG